MVELAMTWLDAVPRADQFTLLKTLGTVTEGGKVDEAAEILQEVQVETCGAMERREKAEYILEQMRLVLGKKDFVRLQIISRKINPKLLNADDFQDIKLKYYEYLVKLHLQDGKFLDIAKAYYSVYCTS